MAHITYLSSKFKIYQNSTVKGLLLCQAPPLTVCIVVFKTKKSDKVDLEIATKGTNKFTFGLFPY